MGVRSGQTRFSMRRPGLVGVSRSVTAERCTDPFPLWEEIPLAQGHEPVERKPGNYGERPYERRPNDDLSGVCGVTHGGAS